MFEGLIKFVLSEYLGKRTID